MLHDLPLQDGGTNDLENLMVLCPTCKETRAPLTTPSAHRQMLDVAMSYLVTAALPQLEVEIHRRSWRDYSELRREFNRLRPEFLPVLLTRSNGRCPICGRDVTQVFHIDHKVPLIGGGGNHIDNLQILCPTCNLIKGATASIVDRYLVHGRKLVRCVAGNDIMADIVRKLTPRLPAFARDLAKQAPFVAAGFIPAGHVLAKAGRIIFPYVAIATWQFFDNRNDKVLPPRDDEAFVDFPLHVDMFRARAAASHDT